MSATRNIKQVCQNMSMIDGGKMSDIEVSNKECLYCGRIFKGDEEAVYVSNVKLYDYKLHDYHSLRVLFSGRKIKGLFCFDCYDLMVDCLHKRR